MPDRHSPPEPDSSYCLNSMRSRSEAGSSVLERLVTHGCRQSGRSSGFRIVLHLRLPAAAAPINQDSSSAAVAFCRFRPRLQRRDRNGFAPFSLFFPRRDRRSRTPRPGLILSGGCKGSTEVDSREHRRSSASGEPLNCPYAVRHSHSGTARLHTGRHGKPGTECSPPHRWRCRGGQAESAP